LKFLAAWTAPEVPRVKARVATNHLKDI